MFKAIKLGLQNIIFSSQILCFKWVSLFILFMGDISHVAIAKRVTKQMIFMTFYLEIIENEAIVDVNRCF